MHATFAHDFTDVEIEENNLDYVALLIPLVSGGLAGAAVNAFITNRKQKLDVTLNIIKDFFAMYMEIGHVMGSLMTPSTLDDQETFQKFLRVGDWFHYVASLSNAGTVDKKLLGLVGVAKSAEKFSQTINVVKVNTPALSECWTWWPQLRDFRNN